MSERTPYIRLFERKVGELVDLEEDFSTEQLGGQIPNVGDIIVSPWMSNVEASRNEPTSRTFWEIVQRYINPGSSDKDGAWRDTRIALVVSERTGKAGEGSIL